MTDSQDKRSKHEGIKKYEKFILDVLNVEYFSLLNEKEKNGYYAVAMLLAYQSGAKPNLKEFAYRLKISPLLLEEPFNSLRANGIFNPIYLKTRRNSEGLGINQDSISNSWMNSKKREIVNWCWIAGVGSGYCGLK